MDKISKFIEYKLPDAGDYCLKILIAILAWIICTKLIRWLIRIFKESMTRAKMPVASISFLSSILKAALYALLVFSIATQLGVSTASVAAVLASAGVGISLALQGGLSNLAGGVILLFLKPFEVGDYIIEGSGQLEGTVQKIEMYYTTLVTYDNRKIVIPNSELTNNTITNVTTMEYRMLELKPGISYESDLKKAKKILEKLIAEEKKICHEKPVTIFVDSLGDSAVVLGFRVWVKTDDYWPVRWRMNEKIKLAFDEEQITIPYNQLEIHMKEQ